MSFQHFRLGELAMHQPLPPHLAQIAPDGPNESVSQYAAPGTNSFSTNPNNSHIFSSPSGPKAPYGSGDTDDGYTLVFPSLQAFNEWREKEEITQMVEFVKGDTHGSKAVPPRFKDHTKLVCARHSRSGRKKYVKKHPERVRKIPSRKLEGVGCSASISYKTYLDKEEVRACYNSQHSHPIGPENYPFTRRGRKAAVQQEKERSKKYQKKEDGNASVPSPIASTSFVPAQPPPQQQPIPQHQPPPNPVQAQHQASNQYPPGVQMVSHPQYQPQIQPQYAYMHQPYAMQHMPGPPMENQMQANVFTQDRWNNMFAIFNTIRENSRTVNYPLGSVAALETVLLRLLMETPPVGPQPVMQPGVNQDVNHRLGQVPQPQKDCTGAQEEQDSDSDESEESS